MQTRSLIRMALERVCSASFLPVLQITDRDVRLIAEPGAHVPKVPAIRTRTTLTSFTNLDEQTIPHSLQERTESIFLFKIVETLTGNLR